MYLSRKYIVKNTTSNNINNKIIAISVATDKLDNILFVFSTPFYKERGVLFCLVD